jgi:hypothetical protein
VKVAPKSAELSGLKGIDCSGSNKPIEIRYLSAVAAAVNLIAKAGRAKNLSEDQRIDRRADPD